MNKRDTFFIGWSNDIPSVDRRFVLGAGITLVAGAAGLGSALGRGCVKTPPNQLES